MADILVAQNFYMGSSQACIVDLNPPTFAGINFLDVESRGQIRAGWSAGTDANNPIRYEVYIKASTATGLFNTANITGITDKLQLDIFTLPDGSFLVNGTTYYVGVRAVDAIGNRDSNVVSQSVISTGVLTSIDTYEVKGSFSINKDNEFQVSLWGDKNETLANSPGVTLGVASYQVYDEAGLAVSGVSGTGVSANAQGLFVFNAVDASLLDFSAKNYSIKATVSIDGENRVNFIPVNQVKPLPSITGAFTINNQQELIGSFWALSNGNKIEDSDRVKLGHYHIHDVDGVAIAGLTQSNISPNADGLFIITPISAELDVESTIYYAHIRIEIDGIPTDHIVPLIFSAPSYAVKAQFSINPMNQLQGTFWVTADNQARTTGLGTANYTVYDASGNAVSGLTQSGITADANGRFIITPISAVALTDLTHYSVKVGIECDAVERIAYKGFTLLGT
jgi:hypothetical protein